MGETPKESPEKKEQSGVTYVHELKMAPAILERVQRGEPFLIRLGDVNLAILRPYRGEKYKRISTQQLSSQPLHFCLLAKEGQSFVVYDIRIPMAVLVSSDDLYRVTEEEIEQVRSLIKKPQPESSED